MNASELLLKDGTPAAVFYCEKCKVVAYNRGAAEQCCQNYKCTQCGEDTGSRSFLICDNCRTLRSIEQEKDRFDKAEKVTQWDGWVYSEGHGHNDGFFPSIKEFLEWMEDWDFDPTEGDGPKPDIRYVWACSDNHFVNVTLGEVIGTFEGETYEDWESDSLHGTEELKAALEKFNALNYDQVSYAPDYTKAILLEAQEGPNES